MDGNGSGGSQSTGAGGDAGQPRSPGAGGTSSTTLPDGGVGVIGRAVGPSAGRRLTKSEYINTVGDIVGVALSDEEKNLLPEDQPATGGGFRNESVFLGMLGELKVWDVTSGREMLSLKGHTGTITATNRTGR